MSSSSKEWLQQGNRFLFYYGGADKYVGVAEAPASQALT